MSIKNFGIIAPGNYSSIKNISLKKVTSKSITPPAVPEMELESIRGIIHEPNPTIEDDEYIFVDSILNVEDEDYPFYEVNADKARIRINNISENVTSIYYVVDDNNANPHELTQTDIDSFNGFDITGGNDTEFPFGEIKKITIYEYVNETEKVLEFYVKLIGAVKKPEFQNPMYWDGTESSFKNCVYEDGVYKIDLYGKPLFQLEDITLIAKQTIGLIISTALEDSFNDGRTNNQVIEIAFGGNIYVWGLRYDWNDNQTYGEELAIKSAILVKSSSTLSQEPFSISNGIGLFEHKMEDSIDFPLTNVITEEDKIVKIRTYIAHDNGRYIRSDFSDEIKIIFIGDDNVSPIFKKLEHEYNGTWRELKKTNFELNNKIIETYLSYTSDSSSVDNIRITFDNCAVPGGYNFSGLMAFINDGTGNKFIYRIFENDETEVTSNISIGTEWKLQDGTSYTMDRNSAIMNISAFNAVGAYGFGTISASEPIPLVYIYNVFIPGN